ncbi:MAG: sterol desaturase family protein [Candidatus Acidiferrales bacterium]
MGKIDPFLVKAVYFFLLSPSARLARYLLVGRAMIFTTAELVKPARDVAYWSVARFDLLAWVGYSFIFFPLAGALSQFLPGYHLLPAALLALPYWLRIAIFFLVADFGHYWIHWLLHTRYFWAAHKWHHSPTYLYWLAGVRSTLPQQFLFNIPSVLLISLLQGSSNATLIWFGIIAALSNDWMHMNVTWRSRWLEMFFVTPRYHQIHHSDDRKYSGKNMGVKFTLWDRLFGTYVDPESVHEKLTFGIGEKENPVRVVLGV